LRRASFLALNLFLFTGNKQMTPTLVHRPQLMTPPLKKPCRCVLIGTTFSIALEPLCPLFHLLACLQAHAASQREERGGGIESDAEKEGESEGHIEMCVFYSMGLHS
jgi:hypothetical protein